jgi:FMN phosphatase YigB (HAD superfamily)
VALLLFDLDDTLLGNEMNTFIPAYIQALSTRMSKVADPSVMIKTLLSATHQMVENQNPCQTLEQTFDAAFYPILGLTRQDAQPVIDDFYTQDFPRLKALTYQKPDAIQMVKQVIDRGDKVAIATNPLFPRTAIVQRLEWAGLSVEQIPYSLVPSYETFHFAKPNPAYFAEFLGQLGWPKIPVVMVGNDVERDIGAAAQIGLPAFWLTQNGDSSWTGEGSIPPHGGFDDLHRWLDSSHLEPLLTSFSTSQALLPVLRATPAALTSLLSKRGDQWSHRPAPNEWSPAEVLCHLRDVDAEVNLPRLQRVIADRNPFLPGQDTDPWAAIREYEKQDGRKALEEFTSLRIEILNILSNLDPDGWDRPARHAIFGPIKLRELVNIIAGHDILHIQQVFKAL